MQAWCKHVKCNGSAPFRNLVMTSCHVDDDGDDGGADE